MKLRGLWQLAWSEFKLNLRNPAMVFWSIAFPALWMSLFGVIASEPIPGFEYEGLNLANFLAHLPITPNCDQKQSLRS